MTGFDLPIGVYRDRGDWVVEIDKTILRIPVSCPLSEVFAAAKVVAHEYAQYKRASDQGMRQ
jgi:hypothetical protein